SSLRELAQWAKQFRTIILKVSKRKLPRTPDSDSNDERKKQEERVKRPSLRRLVIECRPVRRVTRIQRAVSPRPFVVWLKQSEERSEDDIQCNRSLQLLVHAIVLVDHHLQCKS
ncbi:hypothetical protein PFISCL1PPCAC_26367, partial [Pristionchus fissidentatus]